MPFDRTFPYPHQALLWHKCFSHDSLGKHSHLKIYFGDSIFVSSLRKCQKMFSLRNNHNLTRSWKAAQSVPCSLHWCCCCCSVASVVSDSVRPHGLQPTRPLRPWNFPGKSTGVGCHCLVQFSSPASANGDILCNYQTIPGNTLPLVQISRTCSDLTSFFSSACYYLNFTWQRKPRLRLI